MNKRRIRIPFQPLDYNSKHLALPKELIINPVTGRAYVKHPTLDMEIEYLSGDWIKDMINEILSDILVDGASSEFDTLEKVSNIVIELESWKTQLEASNNDGLINTVTEILDMFKGMKESDKSLIEYINNLVTKELGKELSTHDFTNELKNKIDGIEDEANLYIHPEEKVCNFESDVKSVNSQPNGNVILNKTHILGLENVDSNANNYTHPQYQQCSKVFNVQTINGMDGDVIFQDKSLIELSNVENLELINAADFNTIINRTDIYLSGSNAQDIIKSYILDNNLY